MVKQIKKDCAKEMELVLIVIKVNMLDNGVIIKKMDQANSQDQMVTLMKDNGKKVRSMALVWLNQRTGKFEELNTRKEFEFSGLKKKLILNKNDKDYLIL